MVRLVFLISLCVLTFFYGIFTVRFELFPYQILREANAALVAWREVLRPEPRYLFIDHDGAATPKIVQSAELHGDQDLILVTGHPYALRSRCPDFGCMAWITDRSGKIYHSWEADLGALWAETPHAGLKEHGKIGPSGVQVDDAGNLLISFTSDAVFPYGIGMAKFDKDSNLIWRRVNYSHHKFTVAPDGMIYTPASKVYQSPLVLGDTRLSIECPGGEFVSDVILVLDANGDLVKEINPIDLLVEQEFRGLLERQQHVNTCDPIHLNYVQYVDERMAAASGMRAGDLLVSLRNLNMVATIDGRTDRFKWVMVGRTVQQHSPNVAPDGGILVFDNQGGSRELGGSRIVRLTYGQDTLETVYPGPSAARSLDFWTEKQGWVDPHPDGRRALVSLSQQGRLIELDMPSGRILWELHNTHDPGIHATELGASDGDILRLTVVGAYYVGRPAFLTD